MAYRFIVFFVVICLHTWGIFGVLTISCSIMISLSFCMCVCVCVVGISTPISYALCHAQKMPWSTSRRRKKLCWFFPNAKCGSSTKSRHCIRCAIDTGWLMNLWRMVWKRCVNNIHVNIKLPFGTTNWILHRTCRMTSSPVLRTMNKIMTPYFTCVWILLVFCFCFFCFDMFVWDSPETKKKNRWEWSAI